MGILGYFNSAEEQRKEEIRNGAAVPDRSERQRCWEARDGFFACLDRHDVIDSTAGDGRKIAERECARENRQFETDCATAWVTYFKKFRVADYQKKKTFERLEKEGARKIAEQEK